MHHFYRVFVSFPIHCNRMEKSSQHSPQNFSFYVHRLNKVLQVCNDIHSFQATVF